MAIFEIPVFPGAAQKMGLTLGENYYILFLYYVDEEEGGWALDISLEEDVALIAGLPLLPGQDLLEPHADLGIPCRMAIFTPGEPDYKPGFNDLGAKTLLVYEPVE